MHEAITKFISFDTERDSSFFISDDNWKKGKEITSRSLKGEEKEWIAQMSKATMREFIADPHQKIYYVYDHNSPWAFRIELIKIVAADDNGAIYPRCVKTVGDAPKQFTHAEPVPVPEDFDEDAVDIVDAESEDGLIPEIESGIEDHEIPEGIERDESEVPASEDDEVIDTGALPDDDDF
jgi:hypothetical protein